MNVLITCAGRRSYEIAAFKQAVGAGGRVFACDADPNAPAIRMADQAFIVPRIEAPEYVDELLTLCAQYEIGMVVPAFEPELPILAARRGRLRGARHDPPRLDARGHRDLLRQGEDGGLPRGLRDPLPADLSLARWRTHRARAAESSAIPSWSSPGSGWARSGTTSPTTTRSSASSSASAASGSRARSSPRRAQPTRTRRSSSRRRSTARSTASTS